MLLSSTPLLFHIRKVMTYKRVFAASDMGRVCQLLGAESNVRSPRVGKSS